MSEKIIWFNFQLIKYEIIKLSLKKIKKIGYRQPIKYKSIFSF